MFVLVLVVSCVVPLLLALSAGLVAGRFLHDRWASERPRSARVLFGAILVATCLAVAPYTIRASALVRAELAAQRQDWAETDRLFLLHRDLGGHESKVLRKDWISALLNLREWARAERLLLSTVTRSGQGDVRAEPLTIVLLGICRYHQGHRPAAEATLRAVPDFPGSFQRDYYLGRLAEARADREAALGLYRASLSASPRFLPALYQLARLTLESGDVAGARDLLSRFLAAAPEQASDARLESVRRSVALGRPAPPMEFYVVQL